MLPPKVEEKVVKVHPLFHRREKSKER